MSLTDDSFPSSVRLGHKTPRTLITIGSMDRWQTTRKTMLQRSMSHESCQPTIDVFILLVVDSSLLFLLLDGLNPAFFPSVQQTGNVLSRSVIERLKPCWATLQPLDRQVWVQPLNHFPSPRPVMRSIEPVDGLSLNEFVGRPQTCSTGGLWRWRRYTVVAGEPLATTRLHVQEKDRVPKVTWKTSV